MPFLEQTNGSHTQTNPCALCWWSGRRGNRPVAVSAAHSWQIGFPPWCGRMQVLEKLTNKKITVWKRDVKEKCGFLMVLACLTFSHVQSSTGRIRMCVSFNICVLIRLPASQETGANVRASCCSAEHPSPGGYGMRSRPEK